MTREEAFLRLARSKFRSRFHLSSREKAYFSKKGAETIRRHATVLPKAEGDSGLHHGLDRAGYGKTTDRA